MALILTLTCCFVLPVDTLLRGTVPTEIGLLTTLNYLGLRKCYVKTSIPAWLHNSEFANLSHTVCCSLWSSYRHLAYRNREAFSYNPFLSLWVYLTPLTSVAFNLSHFLSFSPPALLCCYVTASVSLEGSIPSELGLCTELTYFRVGKLSVQGHLFCWIRNLL